MYFEYQLTFDDFAEAAVAPVAGKKKIRASWLIIGVTIYFSFLAVCLVVIYLASRRMGAITLARGPSIEGSDQPRQNIWMTLTPALVLIGFLVCAALMGYLDNRRRARIALAKQCSPLDPRPSRMLATLIFLPLLFLLLPNSPKWAVYWVPSSDSVFQVTALSWIAMLCILALIGRLTRHSANLKAFAAARSLRRPLKVEAVDAFLSLDDGLNQCRYDWRKFDRYQETKNLLKLVTEDDLSVIIPKRAAADADTLEALCSLLQTKIAKGTFLPRDPRFQVLPLPVIPMDAAKEQ
jgi:YcxB-like protein